jgi:hypothetical protein
VVLARNRGPAELGVEGGSFRLEVERAIAKLLRCLLARLDEALADALTAEGGQNVEAVAQKLGTATDRTNLCIECYRAGVSGEVVAVPVWPYRGRTFTPRERSRQMTRIPHLIQPSIIALVALAMVAPVAQAMPMPRTADGPAVTTVGPAAPYAGHGSRGTRPDVTNSASLGQRFHTTSSAPVYGAALADRYGVLQPPASVGAVATPQNDNGFNWGAAAIGTAVVALVLGALGIAAARMSARRFAH